jgi:hypothetical protein
VRVVPNGDGVHAKLTFLMDLPGIISDFTSIMSPSNNPGEAVFTATLDMNAVQQ